MLSVGVGAPAGAVSEVLYVDTDSTASEPDGSSWSSAYDNLEDALAQAGILNTDGDSENDIEEIWIAEGTYIPTAELEPGDPRSASFSLVDGVALYGGFAGTETALAERDWLVYETLLSGDLGVVDDASDNAYTVVYCGENIEASVDGVSTTGGNADGESNSGHPERRGGGGIYNSGSLTVTNNTLSDNSAGDYGGGIYSFGTLTVTNSTLAGNSVHTQYSAGGGIYSSGTLTVTGSTFSDNLVNGTHGLGGGIVNSSGMLTVTDCAFSGNSADNRAGGICNSGTLTITSSTFSGNSAVSGGGISNSGTATITNSIFSSNSASGNGGGSFNSGTLTITNSTFSDNSASDAGGIFNSGAVTINNSVLWQNIGGDLGGPLDSGSGNLIGIDPKFIDADGGDYRLSDTSPAINRGENDLAVDPQGNPLTTDLAGNPRIFDSTVDCGAYEFQGAIAGGRETASLIITTAEDVVDLYDGFISLREAIYYADSESLGTTITFDPGLDESTIALCGTAVWIDKTLTINASSLTSLTIDAGDASRVLVIRTTGDDEVELDNLTITGGSASRGGGVYSSGTLTVTDGTFSNNSASGDHGGAVYHSDGVLTVTNVTFSTNSASSYGGAIHGAGILVVTNSTFSDNSAGNGGGGIRNCDSGTLTIDNTSFSGNSAGFGGGIINSGTLTVMNSTFYGNSVTGKYWGGGGISSSGTLTVANTVFSGNVASGAYGGGGGIYSGGTLTVTNSTLADNSASGADGDGGGIWNTGTLMLNNTILAGNTAPNGPDVLDSGTLLTGSNNLIGDGSGQSSLVDGDDGNLVGTSESPIDPHFVRNPDAGPDDTWGTEDDDCGDLRLHCDSPAIDAGDNSLLPPDEFDLDGDGNTTEPVPHDLDGSPRVRNSVVDMGAYEASALLFVDVDAPPNGDGLTWATAYNDPQLALESAAARNSDTVAENDVEEIWIAEGTYTPTAELEPGDPRSASFSLVDGVTIYGGFAGTETALAERDWSVHETVLSGDIGAVEDSADNAYTVVYCGWHIAASLDGLSITGGNADGNNDSVHYERSYGGGIYNAGTLTVTASILSKNFAYERGGAISNFHGSATVLNSHLWGNSSTEYGGAIANYYSTFALINSSLSGNSASYGGGIYNYRYSNVAVTNSTLSGNTASYGGGISNYYYGSLSVSNSVVANNVAQSGPDILMDSGSLTGSHNLIGDGAGQSGLVNGVDGNLVGTSESPVDPHFLRNPDAGPDGTWGTEDDDYGDLRLHFSSPGINTGSNALAVDAMGNPLETDLDGNPRIVGRIVDMGAYEWQNLFYYVNDDAPTLDNWCTAPGSDANDGLSPATPKATVQAVLDAYDLEPGDVVLIDTGDYTLASNILVGEEDAGNSTGVVTFEASPYGVMMDRGTDTTEGVYAWEVNAPYVTLTTALSQTHEAAQYWMRIEGGECAIRVTASDVVLERLDAKGAGLRAIAVGGDTTRRVTVRNCVARGNRPIVVGAADEVTIQNCTVWKTEGGWSAVYFYSSEDSVLRNNILVCMAGFAIELDESTLADSDYNLLQTAETNLVRVDTTSYPTLADWQNSGLGFDANSLGEDPLFADSGSLDFHVQSRGRRYDVRSELPPEDIGAWFVNIEQSPCLNVGLGGVNLGAYGGTEQESWAGCEVVEGDLNGDGIVGSGDLDIVRANWGRSVLAGSLAQGDPSADGLVGSADLDIVRANWGAGIAAAASVVSPSIQSPISASSRKPVEAAGRQKATRYAPHSDAAMETWDSARIAWAEALDALMERYRATREISKRRDAVDLVLAGMVE